MFVQTCVYTYLHMFNHADVCVNKCVFALVYAYIIHRYVCVCIYIYLHMYKKYMYVANMA